MSDEQSADMPASYGGSETEKELYSETKKDFIEDLECLYVRSNQSGRLMFAEKWPQIAQKIFDPELVRFDHEGISTDEDREKRFALEEKAEIKRDEILSYFDGMEKALVLHGSLQLPALEKIMSNLDRTLAELIFKDRFVDKFFSADPNAVSDIDISLSSYQAPNSEASEARTEEQDKQANQMPSGPIFSEADEPQNNAQDDATLKKESVVVPDSESESIGHVDHSYDAKIPDYDNKQGDQDADDDASWLDAPEDEFDDVMPISTESAPVEKMPEPDVQTSGMGLGAHKSQSASENKDSAPDDGMSAPSGNVQQASAPPLPGADEVVDVVAETQDEPSPLTPSAEQPNSPPPPVAPNVPQSSGMGMGAHKQAQSSTLSEGRGAPPLPEDTASAQQSAVPPLPGAQDDAASTPPPPPLPDENAPPAPKKPSLDDIDSHMGASDGGRKPPPLPGQEDDKLF